MVKRETGKEDGWGGRGGVKGGGGGEKEKKKKKKVEEEDEREENLCYLFYFKYLVCGICLH